MPGDTLHTEKYLYKSHSLPHLFDVDKPIFITFRLKFTLPASVVEAYSAKKKEWFNSIQYLNEDQRILQESTKGYTFYKWFDELIAKSDEVPKYLQKQDIRDIIVAALRFHDGLRYDLLAFCVMPNHVHALIYPRVQENDDIFPVAHITYTWKRFTANQINKFLQREGSIWQKESYDHLVRNEKDLEHVVNYIAQNPVSAGLVQNSEDWPGTWVKDFRL